MFRQGRHRHGIAGAFRHRSGRTIAFSRLVLAIVFLFAFWVDPAEPAGRSDVGLAILTAYVLLAATHLVVTWTNWRLEFKLALPAHILDFLVFGTMVSLTDGYTSPFFSLSVFITLSALIKWGWKAAAVTGFAVVLLFVGSGMFALEFAGNAFDLRRFLMRGTSLIVLATLIVWFGFSQTIARRVPAVAKPRPGESDEARPVRAILMRVSAELESRRTIFAWTEAEEPWTTVAQLDGDNYSERRYPPDLVAAFVDPALEGRPFLFDGGSAIAVEPASGRLQHVWSDGPVAEALAEVCGVAEGIAIPIETDSYAGVLIAARIERMCTDDLPLAATLAFEAASALKRASTLAVMEENAAVQTRLSFARDLHDSVVQILAGTSMRLEAIRRSIAAGASVNDELEALQTELATEQKALRLLIQKLRGDRAASDAPVDLRASIAETAKRGARQWGVRCALDSAPERIETSPQLEHELRHMLQEAIANAVRHGRAKTISVALDRTDGAVVMAVEDDGNAGVDIARDGAEWTSKTMRERAQSLGGTLTYLPNDRGSRLTVAVPADMAA